MELTVLAATGATGRELVRQALQRGHTVTAIARDPGKLDASALAPVGAADRFRAVAADVRDAASTSRALPPGATVLSGLGVVKGSPPGLLEAGARAVLASGPGHLIWMGAFGSGPSAEEAGPLTRTLLRIGLRAELPDKVAADTAVLRAGGTVVHCGPLTNGPLSDSRRSAPLHEVPRRLLPPLVSRATVAAAMLDQAESGLHRGEVVVPLMR